jgi:hypothetical protein
MGTFSRDSHDGGSFLGRRNQSAADAEAVRPVRRFIYSNGIGRQQSRAARGSGRTNRLGGFHHRWIGRFQ